MLSRPDPSPDPANNRLHPRTIYGRVETRALGRGTGIKHFGDDRAVYCSFQKQNSYTFRGYVLLGERDVTKFQGCARLAV